MPTTALVPVQVTGLYPSTTAEVVFTAADVGNGNHYLATGRETVLVRNVSEDTAYDMTVVSTPNRHNRTGDLVKEIPFGETHALRLGLDGWRNADRQVRLNGENAAIEFCILKDPA